MEARPSEGPRRSLQQTGTHLTAGGELAVPGTWSLLVPGTHLHLVTHDEPSQKRSLPHVGRLEKQESCCLLLLADSGTSVSTAV